MVFATDFDPIDASSRRQAHAFQNKQTSSAASGSAASRAVNPSAGGSSAYISPVQQTNRLIARAARTQKIAQPTIAKKSAARKVIATKVQPDAEGIAIASRGLSVPQHDPNVLAPLPLPGKPSLPLGLQILNRIQHASTALTGVLIAGALVLYGSSVYVDKSANRAMAHLNYLQDESQQLTSANEAIKQTLAEQATQENSGLEPYESGDVLFIEPAPVRDSVVLEENSPKRYRPMGY